ncbi:MAG: outer membrane beta-barrel protein [Hyphomicrobiales bacterium]
MLTALIAMAVPGPVRAQQVTPLPLPGEYNEPLGLRSGAFIFYPSVETGIELTDNVFQSSQNERGDRGYFVAPALRIESDWVRHSLRVDASSRHLYYFGNPSEDELEVDVRADGRIDIKRSTRLDVEASYNLDQEGRGSINVPGAAAEPPNEHEFGGEAVLTHDVGRFEVSVGGSAEYNLFEDVDLIGGGTLNNSDRNFTEIGGALRIGYDVSPRIQPFVSAEYSVQRYDNRIDDNGLRRDSEQFDAEAGLRFELSPALSGTVAVGYVRREFEDPALSTIDDFTINGSLLWQPTPITSAEFTVNTDIDETGVGFSSGALVRVVGLSVNHALRDNLLLAARAQYAIRDFRGTSLTEETTYLAAGLTYQLNRAAALRAGYSFEKFDSSTAGSDYIENRILVSLLLQR